MDKKTLVIIGAVIILITIIVILSIVIGGSLKKDPDISEGDKIRENTILLAEDYFNKGDFDRALDYLDRLMIEDPSDERVRTLRDQVYAAKQEAELVLRDEEQKSQEELVDTLSNIGDSIQNTATETSSEDRAAQLQMIEDQKALLEEQKKEAEARELAEEQRLASLSDAEREKANKVAALINEGVKELDQENYNDARDLFDEALDLDDDSAKAYAYIGESFYLEDNTVQSNIQKAVQNANLAIDRDHNIWLPHKTLGMIYAQTRQWDNAINEFKEASRLNPESDFLLYELGKSQYRAGEYSDAKLSFEGAAIANPQNHKAYYNLGMTYKKLNNINAALTAFINAATADPLYAAAFYQAGELQGDNNDLINADIFLRKAVSLKPDEAKYNRALAINLYKLGKYSDAEKYFGITINLENDKAEDHYNMARVKIALEEAPNALSFAANAVKLNSDSAVYLYTLGEICELIDNTESAIQAYLQSVEKDNNYILPRINLGAIYDIRGQYDKALEHLLTASQIDPGSLEVNNNLGNVYLHSELYADSIRHYLLAIEKKRNATLMRYNLAIAYIETEQTELAETALNDLLKIDSRYWDAYYRLGFLLYKDGRKSEASAVFKDLLEKNPEYEKKSEIEPLI